MIIQVDESRVVETLRRNMDLMVSQVSHPDTNRGLILSIKAHLLGVSVGISCALGTDSESYKIVEAALLQLKS